MFRVSSGVQTVSEKPGETRAVQLTSYQHLTNEIQIGIEEVTTLKIISEIFKLVDLKIATDLYPIENKNHFWFVSYAEKKKITTRIDDFFSLGEWKPAGKV